MSEYEEDESSNDEMGLKNNCLLASMSAVTRLKCSEIRYRLRLPDNDVGVPSDQVINLMEELELEILGRHRFAITDETGISSYMKDHLNRLHNVYMIDDDLPIESFHFILIWRHSDIHHMITLKSWLDSGEIKYRFTDFQVRRGDQFRHFDYFKKENNIKYIEFIVVSDPETRLPVICRQLPIQLHSIDAWNHQTRIASTSTSVPDGCIDSDTDMPDAYDAYDILI